VPDDDQSPVEEPAEGAAPELSGVDAAKEALARARAASSTAPDRRATGPTSGSRRPRPRRTDGDVRSGPGPDGRDPQLLGSSIDRIMRERGWEQPTAVGGLTGRWAEIVGADVAEHVRPETFEQAPDGRGLLLVLRADSTTWAYSMRQLLPTLRTRLDAELGPGTIRDISVLGPAAPSWKHGKLHIKGRGPRDTYG
jgi:predicted nucleic acid-binding Zn ribbon protein